MSCDALLVVKYCLTWCQCTSQKQRGNYVMQLLLSNAVATRPINRNRIDFVKLDALQLDKGYTRD